MLSCLQHEQVSIPVSLIIAACVCILGGTFWNSALFDKEISLLAPEKIMWFVMMVCLFGCCSQTAFILSLSLTDMCVRVNVQQSLVLQIVFGLFASMTAYCAMRMFVGKLIDFCECRLVLLELGQGEKFFAKKDSKGTFVHSLTQTLANYSKSVELDKNVAGKLRDVTKQLFDRWVVGLGISFIGLLPTCTKIMQAMF